MADMRITYSNGTLSQVVISERVSLMSGQAVSGVARRLAGQLSPVNGTDPDDRPDWDGLLLNIIDQTIQEWRGSGATVQLSQVNWRSRPRWVLRPYIEHAGSTILYAAGGSLKSYLALAMALSVATQQNIVGLASEEPMPVLYLDWEADEQTHSERLEALCRGVGCVVPDNIHYRQMSQPLPDALDTVHQEADRLEAGLLIIDSMMPARGGDANDSEPNRLVFDALREIARPSLILDHVSKAELEKDSPTPLGSISTLNRARNGWTVMGDDVDASPRHVLLRHRKTNNGRFEPPQSYALRFKDGEDGEFGPFTESVRIEPVKPEDVPEFGVKLSVTSQIWTELQGGARSSATIIEALDVAPGAVRVALSRMVKAGKIVNIRGVYGLAAHQTDADR